LSIAYSGDRWVGDATARSSLKIVSPSGIIDEESYEGSGSVPFSPLEKGVWQIILSFGDSVLTSHVSVVPRQFAIVIR